MKKDDKRIMGSNDLLKIEARIDTPHMVSKDIMCHTGGYMSCGVGIIHGNKFKQKLNTKITTESEVVSVSEYVP